MSRRTRLNLRHWCTNLVLSNPRLLATWRTARLLTLMIVRVGRKSDIKKANDVPSNRQPRLNMSVHAFPGAGPCSAVVSQAVQQLCPSARRTYPSSLASPRFRLFGLGTHAPKPTCCKRSFPTGMELYTFKRLVLCKALRKPQH